MGWGRQGIRDHVSLSLLTDGTGSGSKIGQMDLDTIGLAAKKELVLSVVKQFMCTKYNIIPLWVHWILSSLFDGLLNLSGLVSHDIQVRHFSIMVEFKSRSCLWNTLWHFSSSL